LNDMSELTVKAPAAKAGEYKIEIGTDILESVWPRLEKQFGRMARFVVTDTNVAEAGHLEKLLSFRKIPAYVITPAGETSKNMRTVEAILEAMERAYLGRDTVVLALGGGVVGDIAGFAASIFKRGVAVVQLPTTTMAQADSAIGGKTGVDSTMSKNAYGAFWHPSAVFIDVATLKTLDDRQYKSGLVESVKHALIADAQYFDFLEKNLDSILLRQTEIMEKVAFYSCKIKAQVVEADPAEKNQRRMLNYGHTIGHAIESASGYQLLHGEAVAIGIIAAGLIENEMGLGGNNRLLRVRKMLMALGLPIEIPKNINKGVLLDLIKRDKKAINQWPKFVLIDRIGNVLKQEGQWAIGVGQDVVETILEKL
jgi:3-dehydroquinate synthase